MSQAVKCVLKGVVLVVLGLGSGVLSPGRPAQDKREAEWIKSGDPCWPTQQIKAQIKAMTGVTPDYLKCKPVRITMEWDIDEIYHHHSGLGDDRLRAKVRTSFRGNIQTTFNQQKRNQVDRYEVHSPAPCCPGIAAVEPIALHASLIGYKPKGFSGQEFKTFELSGAEILTRTDKPGFFGLRWHRDGSDCVTEMNGPWIKLVKDAIPKPYSVGTSVWIMDQHNYHLGRPVASPAWDELKPYYDKQEVWRKEYAFEDRTDFPMSPSSLSEFYAIHGSVKVEVDFAEEEIESWLLSVEGKERDETPSILGPSDAGAKLKPGPLSVEFDWSLAAKVTTRKRKGVRTFLDAVVTRFVQTPSLIYQADDPYRYDFVPCEGQDTSAQASAMVGLAVSGDVEGATLGVKWPFLPARACVRGTRLKSSGGPLTPRKELGSQEFIEQVSRERLPLKDGAAKTGGLGKWLTYKVSLKKLS
jgi:hypothetical protein